MYISVTVAHFGGRVMSGFSFPSPVRMALCGVMAENTGRERPCLDDDADYGPPCTGGGLLERRCGKSVQRMSV